MNKRLTVQGDVNIELMQNKRNNRPPWKHKYVMNRNNSLESAKRAYVYLNGNTKGLTAFLEKLKRDHPYAKQKLGDNKKMIQWFFDTGHLWEAFIDDQKMRKVITAMRIESYEELDARSYIY